MQFYIEWKVYLKPLNLNQNQMEKFIHLIVWINRSIEKG